MSNIQKEINIEIINHLKDLLTLPSPSQLIWSLSTIQEVNPTENNHEGKVKILINGANSAKIPFTISHQQAVDLKGPVAKLAPTNNYLFHCIGDASINESIDLSITADEDFKKFHIKEINNSLENNNGSTFFIAPNAFESGSQPYREPLMRFEVVEHTVKEGLATMLEEKLVIDDFTITLPDNRMFINPADKTIIQNAINNINNGVDITNQVIRIIKDIQGQELSKKPNDQGIMCVDDVIKKLEPCLIAMIDTSKSEKLFRYINKVRTIPIKRALGLSANSYFSIIDECLIRFEGRITPYNSINRVNINELQQTHQELCQELIDTTTRLQKALLQLEDAYASYL